MEKLAAAVGARFGTQERGDIEYTQVATTPSSSRTSNDDPSRPHDLPSRRTPFISIQTTPVFEVSVNVHAIWHLIVVFLLALVPSFFRTRTKPRKLYPTSYLDGLRGVAALFVVFHHYAINFTVSSQDGWHTGEPGSHDWFFLFPLVRIIHSGRFMVVIFFTISGYVLSLQGLKLIRSGDKEKLLDSLASSVFRRWIRLHIPVLASTFLAFLCARGAVWTLMPGNWDHQNLDGLKTRAMPLPYPQGTFMEQFWDWFGDAQQLCDPFRFGASSNSKYNINNLWTIPVEWMGSMLVFATVLGISRCKTWAKIGSLLILIYIAHHQTRWEWTTFLSGILLAEISLIRGTQPSCSNLEIINEKLPEIKRPINFLSKIFWTLLFILGIYLGAQPQNLSSTSLGYITLMTYLPPQYIFNPDIFFPCLGSVLLIFSLDSCPMLQSLFTTPIAQYLGDISFSLYMLHGQVLFTLGQWIVPKAMDVTGGWENGGVGFGGGLVLAGVVLGPFTVVVSDWFWRGVDQKAVRFAGWVGRVCFVH